MNNSNTGAASGTIFNGSTAQTISSNTIGAPSLANANSFSAANSFTFSGAAVALNSGSVITSNADTGLSRGAAGAWYFGTGAAGNQAGSGFSAGFVVGTGGVNVVGMTGNGVAIGTSKGLFFQSGTAYNGTTDSTFCRISAGFLGIASSTTCPSTQAASTGTLDIGNIQAGGTNNVSGCALTVALGGASAGKFASGTTGACTVTITPGITTTTGYACDAHDLTTPADVINQTAFTTTNNISSNCSS